MLNSISKLKNAEEIKIDFLLFNKKDELNNIYKYFTLNINLLKSHYCFHNLDFNIFRRLVFKQPKFDFKNKTIHGKIYGFYSDNDFHNYGIRIHYSGSIELPLFLISPYKMKWNYLSYNINEEYSIWIFKNIRNNMEKLKRDLAYTFYFGKENKLKFRFNLLMHRVNLSYNGKLNY